MFTHVVHEKCAMFGLTDMLGRKTNRITDCLEQLNARENERKNCRKPDMTVVVKYS